MKELSMLEMGTVLSALGCGLMAGVFFAFSTFVMKALGALPPAQGIAAMQSINVAVINRWFMAAFFGTALLCSWSQRFADGRSRLRPTCLPEACFTWAARSW